MLPGVQDTHFLQESTAKNMPVSYGLLEYQIIFPLKSVLYSRESHSLENMVNGQKQSMQESLN